MIALLPMAFLQQSAVLTGGRAADTIRILGEVFIALLGSIFLIVTVIALISITRRHRGLDQEPLEARHRPSDETERRLGRTVSIASGLTIAIVFGLVTASVSTGRATSTPVTGKKALAVEIIGNQWWWFVRYPNSDASRIVVTANEIHIPVGQPVEIRGTSADVIHSFWVPALQGKRDLIPGRETAEWIEADRPGRFRGQCAEFCGLQHAHMALWVVAEPESQFQDWYSRQLAPAADPADPVKQRGQQVFLNSGCVLCHAISGTTASGQVAPDLTHFGSRLTIAAGTLANNKGDLAGWIADPQSIKPGTKMATIPVKAEDMQPLIEYLESLK